MLNIMAVISVIFLLKTVFPQFFLFGKNKSLYNQLNNSIWAQAPVPFEKNARGVWITTTDRSQIISTTLEDKELVHRLYNKQLNCVASSKDSSGLRVFMQKRATAMYKSQNGQLNT